MTGDSQEPQSTAWVTSRKQPGRREILTHATMSTALEDIMLNERSWSQKKTNTYDCIYICTESSEIHRDRK